VQTHLDEQAPTRLGYERFLIVGDRAAACLLDDENAARLPTYAYWPPASTTASSSSATGPTTCSHWSGW